MNRKFRITLSRDNVSAAYLVTYDENERPAAVKCSGDVTSFIRKDGSPVAFTDTHMDKLAGAVKEQAEECGAEGLIEEVTGKREYQIRLRGKDFDAGFRVTYHPGNAIPAVTSSTGANPSTGNIDVALPDGRPISFSKISATDLKSFVASMAKTNGLNFEFVDLYD